MLGESSGYGTACTSLSKAGPREAVTGQLDPFTIRLLGEQKDYHPSETLYQPNMFIIICQSAAVAIRSSAKLLFLTYIAHTDKTRPAGLLHPYYSTPSFL